MPRIIFTDNLLDNAVSLLEQGNTITEVSVKLGVGRSRDRLSQLLRCRGIKTRNRVYRPSPNAKEYPRDVIRDLHVGGWSVKALSERFGVCRATIKRQLMRDGVKPRDRSEAMFQRYSGMPHEERCSLTEAAHAAIRGMSRSEETKILMAKAKPRRIGKDEQILTEALRARGIKFETQIPINIYNIDILVGSVAVEPHSGGTNPMNGIKDRRRTEYLLDRGISTLWIVHKGIEALSGCLEYIISDINEMGSNPTARSKYGVVRCAVQRFARIRNQRGQFTLVPIPVRFHYIRME